MAGKDDDVLDALKVGGDDLDTDSGAGGVRTDGEIGDLADKVEEVPKKLSIRESIKDAIQQESRSPEERVEERNKNLEKAREVRKLKRETKPDSEVDTDKDVSLKDTSVKGVDSVSAPQSGIIQPPNGWTKEAKALWNALPDEIKKSVAKREKEASDGFKQYGEKSKKYDELEAVIAPRRDAIQRFGVTEAQTVDRLFQWMDSLTGPNKLNSWLALGQNFGINVNEILQRQGAATQTPQQKQQQPQQNQIPDAVKNYVESAVGQVNNFVEQQKREAANGVLTNWAKDKPHFQQVRGTMFALLNTNTIPLIDGNLDLDTAYDYACNANPTIRAELSAKAQEDNATKAAEDAQKAEAQRIIKINKARQAGVSIKPTAHSSAVNAAKKPNSGSGGKPVSVRDSIKNSIAELVGT